MTLTEVDVSGSSNFDNGNDISNTEIKCIDFSALLDDGLLLNTIFRYSSVEGLTHLRRTSSRFHPQIQTFWYRFDVRQQMYYLAKYALDMLAKKPGPFRLQQIKQALCEGGVAIAVRPWTGSRTVTWWFSALLLGVQDYPLPQLENPFLSAILNLFHHQYHGNETLCQNSYHQALEQIGSMNEQMEPLLKMLVSSAVYRPGDLMNAFRRQLKPQGEGLFWTLSVIVENCGEKKLPGVVRELRQCFKSADCWVRGAAIAAWMKIPIHYPSYSKKRWVKSLCDSPIDKTPGLDSSAIYKLAGMAGYCNHQQFSNLLVMVLYLFDDKYWYTSKAALEISPNLVPYCKQEQLTELMSKLLFWVQGDLIGRRCAALYAWIKIEKNRAKQGPSGWFQPLCSLFEVKNKYARRDVVNVSVDMAELCDNRQFTKLTSTLAPRLNEDDDCVRRPALHAWIKIAKNKAKPGWNGWFQPLYLLFKAKSKFVRRAIVEASVDVVKLCDKDQYAKWLLALRVCFRDEVLVVRRVAVQSWVKIGKADPDRQYDDWIKPFCLLLLEKDDSINNTLINGFPEIVRHLSEEKLKRIMIYTFLKNSASLSDAKTTVPIAEILTKHCKKNQLETLVQFFFTYNKKTNYYTSRNAVLILGGMAKHCEKKQFSNLISALLVWLADDRHFESEGDHFFKKTRRAAIVYVLVWIANCCDKKQFASVLKTVLSFLEDPDVEVKELTISLLGKLKKHCDKEQVVELMTALVFCPLDDYTIEMACIAVVDKIVGRSNDKYNGMGWSDMFWYYLIKKRAKGYDILNARKAALQICSGRAKCCDRKSFLALMEILFFNLKKNGPYPAVRIINEVVKRISADQRKEIMHLIFKGETIDLTATPIIKNIIFLDRLSSVTVDKTFYQPLIQLNIIQEQRDFKQEKQDDFKVALDELKKNNGSIEAEQAAEILYDNLLSRSEALATAEKRPVFLMSFFLLKLEMFDRFSKLSSSPNERKAIKEKAKMCATFFCRYHSISMIIQVAKALPYQPFACPKAIKTVINGYLPRRVYALRKRIRPNSRYSAKPSVAREALFSQSSKKRKAQTIGFYDQSNVVTKYPRK
jgi:hypothetical protein